MKLIIKERGWGGHFICSHKCLFRRNTLITYGNAKIVVSTVGLMHNQQTNKFKQIGCDRYFETMAFHANKKDLKYSDADVTKQIYFKSDWKLNEIEADDKANEMHDQVVKELSDRLKSGKRLGKY